MEGYEVDVNNNSQYRILPPVSAILDSLLVCRVGTKKHVDRSQILENQ